MKKTSLQKFRNWMEFAIGAQLPDDFAIRTPIPVDEQGRITISQDDAFKLVEKYIQQYREYACSYLLDFAAAVACHYLLAKHSIHVNARLELLHELDPWIGPAARPAREAIGTDGGVGPRIQVLEHRKTWNLQSIADMVMQNLSLFHEQKTKFLANQAVVYDCVDEVDSRLTHGQLYYFLGEIPNSPTHCIVVSPSGQTFPMVAMQFLRHPTGQEL